MKYIFQKIKYKNTHTHTHTHTHKYVYMYTYTVMVKNIGTLCKYDQRRLWKSICFVNLFDIFL